MNFLRGSGFGLDSDGIGSSSNRLRDFTSTLGRGVGVPGEPGIDGGALRTETLLPVTILLVLLVAGVWKDDGSIGDDSGGS